jgi:hypothetical protein
MTEKASRRNRTVYPFPTRRVLIPFEWKFSAEEFERVKVGVFPDDMGHWLIFLEGRRRQFLYFVRSWSGYTVYKLLVEKSQHEYRVAEAWVSRDPHQYTSTDPKYDAEILAMVIENVLLNPEVDRP